MAAPRTLAAWRERHAGRRPSGSRVRPKAMASPAAARACRWAGTEAAKAAGAEEVGAERRRASSTPPAIISQPSCRFVRGGSAGTA